MTLTIPSFLKGANPQAVVVAPLAALPKRPFVEGDFANIRVYTATNASFFSQFVRSRVEVVKFIGIIALDAVGNLFGALFDILMTVKQLLVYRFSKNAVSPMVPLKETFSHLNRTRVAIGGLLCSIPALLLPSKTVGMYKWCTLVQEEKAKPTFVEKTRNFVKTNLLTKKGAAVAAAVVTTSLFFIGKAWLQRSIANDVEISAKQLLKMYQDAEKAAADAEYAKTWMGTAHHGASAAANWAWDGVRSGAKWAYAKTLGT